MVDKTSRPHYETLVVNQLSGRPVGIVCAPPRNLWFNNSLVRAAIAGITQNLESPEFHRSGNLIPSPYGVYGLGIGHVSIARFRDG